MPQHPPAGQPGPRREQSLLRPITVDDLARSDVVTVQRDTPVRTAVASMVEHDVGTVVVVDDREPVGIITDRMVATALESDPAVADRRAGDLMADDLVTVTTDADVDEVLSVLADAGIRRVPVVDDRQQLQGIVSLDDVVVLLASQLDRVGQVVEKQAPRF